VTEFGSLKITFSLKWLRWGLYIKLAIYQTMMEQWLQEASCTYPAITQVPSAHIQRLQLGVIWVAVNFYVAFIWNQSGVKLSSLMPTCLSILIHIASPFNWFLQYNRESFAASFTCNHFCKLKLLDVAHKGMKDHFLKKLQYCVGGKWKKLVSKKLVRITFSL